MCILFVNKQMLVCNIKFCSQPCVAFSLLLNYNIYSLNLYLPIKVCISYQTCLNSCHLSEFSQQTFKLWHILTVLTCYWSWDFSWLEIFFLATFQRKGRRLVQTRHRSTTPKKRTIASQSHPVTGFNIVWFDFFSCLKCLHSFCIQDSCLPELFCSSQASSHVGIFLSFWSSSIEQCPFSPIVIGSDKQTVQTVKLALSLLF